MEIDALRDVEAAGNADSRGRGMTAGRAVAPEPVGAAGWWRETAGALIATGRGHLRARIRRTRRQEHRVRRANDRSGALAVFQ